jgi:hypothetical protein
MTPFSSKPDPVADLEFEFRVPWKDRYKFAAKILGIPLSQVICKEFTELPDSDR